MTPHSVSIVGSLSQNPVSPCFPADMRVLPPIAQKTQDSPTIVSMAISNQRCRIQISPCQIRTALRERCATYSNTGLFRHSSTSAARVDSLSARLLNWPFFHRRLLATRRRKRSIVRFGPNLGKSRGLQFEIRQAWHYVEDVDDLREIGSSKEARVFQEVCKSSKKVQKYVSLIPERSARLLGLQKETSTMKDCESAKRTGATLRECYVPAFPQSRDKHLSAYSHVCGHCSHCVWR